MFKLGFVLTICVAFSIALMPPASAKDIKDAGFSGKWALDKHSNAPQGLDDLEQRIKQNGNDITIDSKFPEPKSAVVPLLYLGVMTTTMHLSADGSEVQNQIGPFQQGSKTTINGNQMETEWTAMVNGEQVQGHWTRTLSPDGKHMTLIIKESSTQGQHGDAELHFTRK